MISVCMATYNGAQYIREQLDSILPQLGPADEIVVCDDRSKDDTLGIVESYGDPRIRAYRNEVNLGHVRNFEKALTLARGDFIFLSDQDDRWLPGRVEHMMSLMAREPDILLLASNFDLIGMDGADIGEYRLLGPTKPTAWQQAFAIFAGRAPYWGCTFLMKRDILQYCLPIPKNIESHDIWIALTASVFGRVMNIAGPTLKRRIHGSNLTATSRRALSVVLKSRYHFLHALASRTIFLKFKKHRGSRES
jgi:glycosyltransferase involved in cell wall biosynthesis